MVNPHFGGNLGLMDEVTGEMDRALLLDETYQDSSVEPSPIGN